MRIEIKTDAAASHLNAIRNKLADLCDTLREELQASILDADEVSQLIGDTNATDWRVNVFEVDLLALAPFESGIKLRFYFQASGEQDEEKMLYGDKIEGNGSISVYDVKLVVLNLTAALVESPAERDGEEEAINNCEPDDDGPDEDDDGPDEDDDGPAERDGEEEAINNCEPDDDGPDEDDDHEPEDEPKKLS